MLIMPLIMSLFVALCTGVVCPNPTLTLIFTLTRNLKPDFNPNRRGVPGGSSSFLKYCSQSSDTCASVRALSSVSTISQFCPLCATDITILSSVCHRYHNLVLFVSPISQS